MRVLIRWRSERRSLAAMRPYEITESRELRPLRGAPPLPLRAAEAIVSALREGTAPGHTVLVDGVIYDVRRVEEG